MGSSEAPPRQAAQRRLIPYELSSHFWTYIEERLYTHALLVLAPLLTTHTPPTPHIALLHTLCLHPSLTTRTTSGDLHAASNRSHSLLNLILARHGPRIFGPACRFQHSVALRGGRRSLPSVLLGSTSSDYEAPESIPLAHSGSLYHRASDFWHALGWALNCSVLHPLRWRVWLPWLRLMCQLLEDDWRTRRAQSSSDDSGTLKQSLIYMYVWSANRAEGSVRRIMRAIFTSGDARSQDEFKEVWKGELKGPKEDKEKPKKREVDVDVDAEVYGDYLVAEDSDDDEATPENPRLRRRKSARNGMKQGSVTNDTASANPSSSFGGSNGIDSLRIRIRLLNLLSSVSVHFPTTFTAPSELYTLYVEFIQPLPLRAFQSFVLPSGSATAFTPDAHTTLCEYLLYRLIANDYVPTDEAFLTQEKMEQSFLPFPANGGGPVGNAKVGLLLESMLRYLAREGKLKGSNKLREVVEEGIRVRIERAGERNRRKKGNTMGGDEDEAWTVLSESSERTRHVVETV